MELPRVDVLECTCEACPSQWEAALDDGRIAYIRYRFGCLSVGIGPDINAAAGACYANTFSEVVGDGLDGVMAAGDMMEHTAGVLDWSRFRNQKVASSSGDDRGGPDNEA